MVPIASFLQVCCLGKYTGISFIDSAPIHVYHIKREFNHKIMKGLSTKGQCSTGWFFGFKLNIVINDKGEILDFLFTQANVDNRQPLKLKNFHEKVFGELFGDKGYISNLMLWLRSYSRLFRATLYLLELVPAATIHFS
jgi:Transposase DDE domain